MDSSLQKIREEQRQTWNKFSTGWKNHDEFNMSFLKPIGEAIISSLQLKDTDTVLDIATGTGEPGLTIASIAKNGKVVGTDLAEDMLVIANENAEKRGLKNYTTQVCDVCELPFADHSFDAVSCRFGFMFFPDMLMAAKEMVRVLKPGGRLATSVWAGAEKNGWLTATMDAMRNNIELPVPVPGAPGIFRCAKPGLVTGILQQAGLHNISEENVDGIIDYRSNEFYWANMTEIVAPVMTAMAKADDRLKEKIRNDVFAIIDHDYPGANFTYGTIIISGSVEM
jgi:ubiquinone/menaquinone biosynthesis C-methylase UbiE